MSVATSPQVMVGSTHGRPNWTDLHTAQPERARSFYRSLLGWEFPDSSSVVARVEGDPVAEIVTRSDRFDADHLLSNWFPYVEVADVDRALDAVDRAGGLVLSPAAARDDGALVATVLDPSDALLRIWQQATGESEPRLHRPGALTWIELETGDVDRARSFYREVFGWEAGEVSDPSGSSYVIFLTDGYPVGGAVWTPLADIPASWCTAFAVSDTDEATRRAVDDGGVVMADPTEMAMGRQSVVVDPTGAVFALLGPAATGPRPL